MRLNRELEGTEQEDNYPPEKAELLVGPKLSPSVNRRQDERQLAIIAIAEKAKIMPLP